MANPSAARRRAIARPSPAPAPVTTALSGEEDVEGGDISRHGR